MGPVEAPGRQPARRSFQAPNPGSQGPSSRAGLRWWRPSRWWSGMCGSLQIVALGPAAALGCWPLTLAGPAARVDRLALWFHAWWSQQSPLPAGRGARSWCARRQAPWAADIGHPGGPGDGVVPYLAAWFAVSWACRLVGPVSSRAGDPLLGSVAAGRFLEEAGPLSQPAVPSSTGRTSARFRPAPARANGRLGRCRLGGLPRSVIPAAPGSPATAFRSMVWCSDGCSAVDVSSFTARTPAAGGPARHVIWPLPACSIFQARWC